jgi:hypothetical protein
MKISVFIHMHIFSIKGIAPLPCITKAKHSGAVQGTTPVVVQYIRLTTHYQHKRSGSGPRQEKKKNHANMFSSCHFLQPVGHLMLVQQLPVLETWSQK